MDKNTITECKREQHLKQPEEERKIEKSWAKFLKGGEEELRETKKEALVKNKQKGTSEKGRTKIKKKDKISNNPSKGKS